MKTGSKRGAALAYVIVVSAALMILASALVFSAKFNLDSATNSLESRQAYLDAKSAIEYGRAYVLQNPDAGSFTVLKTSEDSGFKIGSGENAVAEYDSTRKLIKASAKYRSSDRVRKLGYQFTTEENGGSGGSGLPYSFLAVGTQFGSQNGMVWLFHDNGDYVGQGSIAFPIVATKAAIFQGTQTMDAPEVNFIGRKEEMDTYNCFFSNNWDNATTLKADFIGFDGDIVGKAYVQSDTPKNGLPNPPELYIKSKTNSSSVIVRFSRKLKIEFVDPSNKLMTDYTRAKPVEFEAGYYSFPNGTNLFDLETIKSKATKLTEDEVKEVLQQYQTARYTNADIPTILSSESISSVRWTSDGKMENTNPTAISAENATVFLCASQFLYQGGNVVKFIAPNIVFQWNSGSSMAVSFNSYATVSFQVKNIFINMKNNYGNPPIEQKYNESHFYILNSEHESPIITFVTDTTIKTSKGTITIDAGVYRIGDDNRVGGTVNPFKIDLFDKDLELEKIADVGESGGSGSGGGGTEITGGVYTDGE